MQRIKSMKAVRSFGGVSSAAHTYLVQNYIRAAATWNEDAASLSMSQIDITVNAYTAVVAAFWIIQIRLVILASCKGGVPSTSYICGVCLQT